MAAPTKNDLDSVFGKGAPAEGAPIEPDADDPMADDAGNEEALNMAIDEAFETDDPDLRREAFKNAMRLCMASGY